MTVGVFTAVGFIAPGVYDTAFMANIYPWLAVGACIAGLVAMRWRRSYPVIIATVLILFAWPFPVLWLISGWAYMSLATHRRWRATIGVGLLLVAISVAEALRTGSFVTYEGPNGPETDLMGLAGAVAVVAFSLIATVAVAALGSYVGARRDAEVALQERIAAAEREQVLVQEASRAEERTRIAREMHDVLAHKISLISMHAGALAYRDDLTGEETRKAAQTIQESSHQALQELRVILGQLRQIEGHGSPAKPQPTLDSLEELVAEHRAAGRQIRFTDILDGRPSHTVSRHAYRVVQEALTNAAKHAPGTAVQVEVSGDPERGLDITVVNARTLAHTSTPGSQLGLLGLEERVALVGGRLSAGPAPDGTFRVEAWVPW